MYDHTQSARRVRVGSGAIDRVECLSCGQSYEAERYDANVGPACCGACGNRDDRMLRVLTIADPTRRGVRS
jgi:hypothetical protein